MTVRAEFVTMGLVDMALDEAWRELAAISNRMLPNLTVPAHLVPDQTSTAIAHLSRAVVYFPSGRRGSIAERRSRAFAAAGVQWLALHGLKSRWQVLSQRGDDEQRHARLLTQDAYRRLVLELLPRLRREFQHVRPSAATQRPGRRAPKRSRSGGIDWYALPDQYRYRTCTDQFMVLPGMRVLIAFESEPGRPAWHVGVIISESFGLRDGSGRCYAAFETAAGLCAALRDSADETLLPITEAARFGIADAHAACDRLEARLRGLGSVRAWLHEQINTGRIC